MDYGARWYDGAIGRWTAVDPIADQFPSHAGYSYAINNPIRYIEYLGLGPSPSTSDLIVSAWAKTEDGETQSFSVSDGKLETSNNSNESINQNSEECCPDGNPDPFVLAEILYHAWWGIEDGFGNMALLPILPKSVKARLIRNIAKENGLDLSSLSNQELLAHIRLKKVMGELVIVPQAGFFQKLLEHGTDAMAMASAFYGGSVLLAKAPSGFKMLKDAYLKSKGVNAEALKADFVGNSKVSRFDLYKQNRTNEIWIFKKGGTGGGIPTGIHID